MPPSFGWILLWLFSGFNIPIYLLVLVHEYVEKKTDQIGHCFLALDLKRDAVDILCYDET